MEFDTQFAKQFYSKKECKVLNTMKDPKKIRIKVLTDDVKELTGKIPQEYRNLPHRYVFDDHRVFLKVGNVCIGFMVSPYNLNTERHKALFIDGHSVIEIRQQHHPNAETFVVLKNEYTNVVMWKLFEIK